MQTAKEKMLELLDAYQAALEDLTGSPSAPPWAPIAAIVLPLCRSVIASSSDEHERRFIDALAAGFASFRGDEDGGFIYVPARLSPTGRAAAYTVDYVYDLNVNPFASVALGRELRVPAFSAELVAEAVRDFASLPIPDPGDWLLRLGQVDGGLLAAPEVPGPESGDRPGQ